MDNILSTTKTSEKKRQGEYPDNITVLSHFSFLRHKSKILDNLKKEKQHLKESHTSTRKNMFEANVNLLNNKEKADDVKKIYEDIYNMYQTEVTTIEDELTKLDDQISIVKDEVSDLEKKTDNLNT